MLLIQRAYTGPVDLSTEAAKQILATELREMVKTEIPKALQALDSNTFDFSPYALINSLKTQDSSALEHLAGFYLLINTEEKKIYFGSTSNFARRRREHRWLFARPQLLAIALREAVLGSSKNTFSYVPLVGFSTINFSEEWQRGLEKFLDDTVESPLLEEYLASSLEERFYNVKIKSAFQPGNPYGGTPGSGQPSRPAAIRDECAWESVSAAAEALKMDRRLVRNKIARGFMRYLTSEEYATFPGRKMTMKEAHTFLMHELATWKRYAAFVQYRPRSSRNFFDF